MLTPSSLGFILQGARENDRKTTEQLCVPLGMWFWAPNVQGSFKPCETAKTRLSCWASRGGLRTGGRQAVGAAGNQAGPRGRAEARDILGLEPI